MEIEERIGALEKHAVIVVEALRFLAEQKVRDDAYTEAKWRDSALDREAIRTEAVERYRDHEGRLRASEKALA